MKPAINHCNKALALKHDIEKSFLVLGKLLHEIKDGRLFEAEGMESWGEFLMEMRMSESMASKLITIYQKFILELEISPKRIAEAGGWTVVYDLVPLAKDKASAEDWLDRAGSMTRTDIKKEAMVARGLPEPKDCEHEWAKVCLKCRMRYDE